MKTSLIIESTTSEEKTKQKSIPDINPKASSQEMLEFAQSLIDLTTNSYTKTIRIDKTDLDSQSKQTRTITSISLTGSSTAQLVDGVWVGTVQASKVTGSPAAIGATCSISSISTTSLAYIADFQAPSAWFMSNLRMLYSVSGVSCYPATRDTSAIVGNVIETTIVVLEDDTYAELRIPIQITIVED